MLYHRIEIYFHFIVLTFSVFLLFLCSGKIQMASDEENEEQANFTGAMIDVKKAIIRRQTMKSVLFIFDRQLTGFELNRMIYRVMRVWSLPVELLECTRYPSSNYHRAVVLYFNNEATAISYVTGAVDKWDPHTTFYLNLIHNPMSETTFASGQVCRTFAERFNVFRCTTFRKGNERTSAFVYEPGSRVREIDPGEIKFDFINLHGHPIRAGIFERMPEMILTKDERVLGFSWRAMHAVVGKLNMTLFLSKFHEKVDSGKVVGFTEMLQKITKGELDAAFNSFFIRDVPGGQYLYTSHINHELLCAVVPKAHRIPQVLAPLFCFSWQLWLWISTSLILVYCVRYVLSFVIKLPPDIDGHLLPSDICLSTFAIFIYLPYRWSRNRFSDKIVAYFFLVSSFVLVTAFQASLLTMLNVPKYYKDIETLNELRDSRLSIVTRSRTVKKVLDDHPTFSNFSSRIQFVRLQNETKEFETLAHFSRTLYSKKQKYSDFVLKERNRQYLVHTVKECVVNYYTGYIVNPGFPFFREIDAVLKRIVYSGLVRKWEDELIWIIYSTIQPTIHSQNGFQVYNHEFSLEDMQIAFIILISGYFISFATLTIELVIAKYSLNANKSKII